MKLVKPLKPRFSSVGNSVYLSKYAAELKQWKEEFEAYRIELEQWEKSHQMCGEELFI